MLATDHTRHEGEVEEFRVFAIVWAMATLFHIWLDERSLTIIVAPDAGELLHVALGVAALVVLWFPARVGPLLISAILQLYSAWSDMPRLSSHWLLAALVAMALVLVAMRNVIKGHGLDSRYVSALFFPVARVTLIVGYGFAALSKLNWDFLAPAGSCAPFLAEETLSSFGISPLPESDAAAWTVIGGAILVEVSVPVLLAFRRTRNLGVLIGMAFHGALALDLARPLTDFTLVLWALFLPFLPPQFSVWFGGRIYGRPLRVLGVIAVSLTLALWTWPNVLSSESLRWAQLLLWMILAVSVISAVSIFVVGRRCCTPPGILRVSPRWLLVVPLIGVANGLAPYLELKTEFSWTMYSNLVTVNGQSNHMLIGRTLPLGNHQQHLVTVIASNDEGLQRYADEGYRIPLLRLRAYTSRHPGISLRYELNGGIKDVPRVGSDPLLSRRPSVWQEKLSVFQAVDAGDTVRCQAHWGAVA